MLKISTIIAVYNVEEYLEDCLHCLLNQTYPLHEIIAVNDGSTDRSVEILEAWAEKFEYIRVVHQENSGGPGSPRNTGLQLATGDYISFIDPDDYVDRNYYKKLAGSIMSECDPEIVIANMLKFNSKRTWEPHTFHKMALFQQNRLTTLYECPALIHNLSSTNKLFKRTFLTEHNLRFLEGSTSEEIHFTSCCLYLAQNIYINKDAVYYWRRRENSANPSISQQKAEFQSVLNRIESHKLVDHFLEEHGLIQYRYIKDVRVILDFMRHAHHLYDFHPQEQELFFTLVNEYMETIDEKAYDHLPHDVKTLCLARLWFLKNRLDFELVASVRKDYGFLPTVTEINDGNPAVLFDFRYLKEKHGNDPLYVEKVEVPSRLISGEAFLKEGKVNRWKLTLIGYGYIDYVNVQDKEQIQIDILLKKRGSDETWSFPAQLRASPEMNGVIKHQYCKFTAKMPVRKFKDWLEADGVVDIRLSITVDGLTKVKRLSSIQEENSEGHPTLLNNASPTAEIYITNKGNISIKRKRDESPKNLKKR